MAAEVLLKKGKRGAAAYIQSACSSRNHLYVVNEVFNLILDPEKRIDDWDKIDWCRWLLAGGKTPDEFGQTVRRYDNATTCGLVWTANFVAYRCRTCSISPCMSLCSDCFQRGNHEGHDFNMFRSQAGGACDCGDKSVMKEYGFCNKHSPKMQLEKPEAPPDLLCVAESFMPRLFLRLIQHLREYSSFDLNSMGTYKADGLLVMLHQHSEMGAAMREVMTNAFTNPQTYAHLTTYIESTTAEKSTFFFENLKMYHNCLKEAESITSIICDDITKQDLKQGTFLGEIVFWMIKYEFPQKLVCLLLNMMSNHKFKDAFTVTFVNHYSLIGAILQKSTDIDSLSNRVVHVSVQLFSNEDLSFRMTKECGLLHVMVGSLMSMIQNIAQPSSLQCADKNANFVVDCGHHVMKNHCYWPMVSDFNNTISHRPVALELLGDNKLLEKWFNFLSLLQGMNVNQRELSTHVEFEPNTYYASFSAEIEASSTPMWALISHLKTAESSEYSKNFLNECLKALMRWLAAIPFTLAEAINPYQVSFHLPLHRCFALFLCQAIRNQGMQLSEIIQSNDTLQLLMMHPMQAQVAVHEIMCGMWVRCGMQIRGQAMTYIQCHFCYSFVDADLFLLQLCATHLNHDWFLKTVLNRFHIWDWFTFHPNRDCALLDRDQVYPMLEGVLCFLATLIATHSNIDISEEDVNRKEMVSLLCTGDRTHSQLIDMLPDKCGSTSENKDFEPILNQVADYKAPSFEVSGTMVQGMYVPKPEIWANEYDPIHVLLRAVHRKDYQSSLDRFAQFLRSSSQFSKSALPWPPFRIPGKIHPAFQDPRKILHSKFMHGIIFTVLYRALNEPDVPEQVLSLCIYLLDMAVQFPNEDKAAESEPSIESVDVIDVQYEDWFQSNDTLTNISRKIKKVIVFDKVVMAMKMVEDMEVEDEEEEVDDDDDVAVNTVEMDCTNYETQSSIVVEEVTIDPSIAEAPPIAGEEPPLALPPSNSNIRTAFSSNTVGTELYSRLRALHHLLSNTSSDALESSTPGALPLPSSGPSTTASSTTSDENMAIVPTSAGLQTLRPKCLKVKKVPGRQRMFLMDKGLPQIPGQSLKSVTYCNKRDTDVNESILSLLVALYSKLVGKPNAYKTISEKGASKDIDNCRHGDGVDVIGRLLDNIIRICPDKDEDILAIKKTLYPQLDSDLPSASCNEAADKEERRKKAKERQKKLMAEFASKQKAFLQKTMETDAKESTSSDQDVDEVVNMQLEYECVICGQTTVSDEIRPMGIVVLLQATSVLGHSNKVPPSGRRLPCSDEDRLHLQKEQTLAHYMKNRIDQLTGHFDNKYWQMAVNIGWEGGVHVQMCGHYLHLSCHTSYMTSLKCQSSRHQCLNVDQGEYSCPLCRQLANSVIPLSQSLGEMGAVARCQLSNSHLSGLSERAAELSQLINSPLSKRESTMLKTHMKDIIEDLTSSTFPQYRAAVFYPNSTSVFLFLCSIARTNLEIELVQKQCNLTPASRTKSCFLPLLHVLSMHSRVLTQTIPTQMWNQLTGQTTDDPETSLVCLDPQVPLILKDCITILIQLILCLPLNIDKAYFSCVVQILYNVVFVQSIMQLSCCMNEAQRTCWKIPSTGDVQNNEHYKRNNFHAVLSDVIHNMEETILYLEDDDMQPTEKTMEWTVESMDYYVRGLCLHFLRIAALLQSHLYPSIQPLEIKDCPQEFGNLCQYLGLAEEDTDTTSISTASCLAWPINEPSVLIKTWCEDYGWFVNKSVIAARNLLQRPLQWFQPALLKLPENYDQIFQYHHQRPCSVCHSVPKDPSICLVCGTMVCLREICCRQISQCEAVSHSVVCGAGTAMYLAVNSSTIVAIRGKRACLWGSVYLDSFGEEDRDLKRGKPLFLNEDRYKLLQSQWLQHSFNHTNKRWVWHKDNL